jgi:hypothetical protein
MDKIAQFQKIRGKWLSCIVGEDRHSIQNQITDMIWNEAAYNIVRKSYSLAPKVNDDKGNR